MMRAHEGRVLVLVPFSGRKNGTVTSCEQPYNNVLGVHRKE